MGEPGPILVVADPTSETQPAVARAMWLAEQLGAEAQLFICDYDPHLAGEGESLGGARRTVLDAHLRRLRELAEPFGDQGVAWSVDASWDHPLHEGIVRKVRELRPRLVVKDTHFHSVIKRTVFSNTDWHLIRDCPAPLLLVKPRAVSARPVVMAAVDPVHEHDKPAELDREILSQAQVLCRAVQGELHVLHAFDPAPAIAAATSSIVAPISTPMGEFTGDLAEQHRLAFDELMSGAGVEAFQPHFHQGSPQDLLVALAEELGADVVVMGAVSRRGHKRIFIGSTAERVLDRLPCDVLIVKVKR